MQKRLKQLINYETISYLIAGVLTTAVDYVVFILVNENLKRLGSPQERAVLLATVLSWAAAVLFAYVVNKLFVFRNYRFSPKYLLRELGGFLAARAGSGIAVLTLMWLMTGPLCWNEYIAKILTSVFNMVFNYVASKLWIFKK